VFYYIFILYILFDGKTTVYCGKIVNIFITCSSAAIPGAGVRWVGNDDALPNEHYTTNTIHLSHLGAQFKAYYPNNSLDLWLTFLGGTFNTIIC